MSMDTSMPSGASPTQGTPAKAPTTDASRAPQKLELVLAKQANGAIAQGNDPKRVSELLSASIRYARNNPELTAQAERALAAGFDPTAVANKFGQAFLDDPVAASALKAEQRHQAFASGALQKDIAAKNAADMAEQEPLSGMGKAAGLLAKVYQGLTLGAGNKISAGLESLPLVGTGPVPTIGIPLVTTGLPYGENLKRYNAALEQTGKELPVASTVAEMAGSVLPILATGGGAAPAAALPEGAGMLARLGQSARALTAGAPEGASRVAKLANYAKQGALYGGATGALSADQLEDVPSSAISGAGKGALFAPLTAVGAGAAGKTLGNIAQRTGATDFLGALAQKVGLDRVAENIGTKGAVNDILRVRQRIIDALGVPAETADQYLDAMVKQGRAATAPAYAAAKETASTVEAAPGKAAAKLSELWQQAKTKLLPGPGETVTRPYEGPSHAEAGYQGSDLLDDVMHRMEAQKQSAADALTDAMRDAKGKYAPADISKAMDALGIPRAGTPFGSSPMTLEQGAKHNYTWPVGESPGAPAIQSSEPGAPNFREADYTRPTPVKLRAANDVNVRRPATPEAVPEPSSTAPNIPAAVEQARTEAFAHPQVQRYLKQLYREAPELKGQTGYDVADQLKRDMNRDWGALKPADRAGEYGGSLREAKGLVQDYLDALSEGKAGEANAVHRAEVAVPREFFLRGSKLNVTPKGKALETNSLAALQNDIAKLPPELQATAQDAARAGRAADVVQTLRAQGVPETQSALLTGLDFDKIRPAFKTEAEFQTFVQKVAQMRQAAAAQEARFGPPMGVRSFYKPQNPLATPRGIGLRTMAEGTPMASPPAAMPQLSRLWNTATLAPAVVNAKR